MEIEIEKDVPLTTVPFTRKQIREKLDEMQEGDSFFVPREAVQAVRHETWKHPAWFRTKKWPGGYRCWKMRNRKP